MEKFSLKTRQHTEFVDITEEVARRLPKTGAGVVTVYVPHTTAGITIQENADPDVVSDMIGALERMVPWKHPTYRHAEGNTAAHVKSALLGQSAQIFHSSGRLHLGTWQGIYFCEFDGPRSREVWIRISAE